MPVKEKQKTDLYEFDPVKHIGKFNGVVWPSVTQLLQEEALIDYSSVPAKILAEKSLLGIRSHAATVLLDNGSLDQEHFETNFPECVPYLEAYRKFRLIENFEPIHKEARYFSRKWKFHGQPDESGVHICKMAGDTNALIDYKCTWTMYASTGPQLSGYELLIKENLGMKIKKRFGLLLKPTGNYELFEFKDSTDKNDFLACLHLHWARRTKYKTRKGVFNNGEYVCD